MVQFQADPTCQSYNEDQFGSYDEYYFGFGKKQNLPRNAKLTMKHMFCFSYAKHKCSFKAKLKRISLLKNYLNNDVNQNCF